MQQLDPLPMEESVEQSIARNLLDHRKWDGRIMRLLWAFVVILVLFEGLIAVLYCSGMTLGANHTNAEYLRKYFLTPCAAVLATVGISNLLIVTLLRNISVPLRSRVIVTTLVLVVSEIVAFNHGTSVIFVMYVLPIFLSIVYFDRSTLFFSYLLCVVLYLAVLFGYLKLFVNPAAYRHTYMDILTNIGLMTAVYLLSRLVFERIEELINMAVTQCIRQTELTRKLSLDSLTQLFNHATFYEKLDEHIVCYKKDRVDFSLMVIDLDNFKSINDTYGHDVGDTVILQLVDIIRENTSEQDIAFRYGGEEFTILSIGRERAEPLAEAIRAAMAAHCFPGIARSVTVSIGLCHYDESFGGRREFFASADKALYRAKHSGKNCVRTES